MEFTGERYVPSVDGQTKYEHLHRYALSLSLARGKSVLDIACGEGYGSALLAQVAKSVVGVDIDATALNYARQSYYDKNLTFLAGSCDSIPLPDQSVEVVTSFETIEHHDKHEEMMLEIKRVLKPGGLLIISSPNRFVYSDEPNYVNEYHVKELYYDELMELLGRHFKRVRCHGQRLATGSFVFPLGSAGANQYRAYTGDARQLIEQVCPLPAPVYFLAVCSDASLSKAQLDSVYMDSKDDLLKKLEAERLNHIHQLQLQVEGFNDTIAAERAVHQSQRAELAAQFTTAQTQIAQQEADLERGRKQLAIYEAQLAQRAEEWTSAQTLIAQQEADLERGGAQLAIYEAQVVYEEKLAQQAREIADMHSAYEAQFNLKAEALSTARTELLRYEARVSEQTEQLTKVSEQQMEMQALLTQQGEELSTARERLSDLLKHLHQQDEMLAKARAQLSADETEIQGYHTLLSETHAQISKTAEVLNWIYASRSWRLSTKLRQIERLSQPWHRFEQKIRRRLLLPSREIFQGMLDFPKSENILSNSLGIYGWVYSTVATVTRVEAFLDDVYLGSVRYGIERPDVVAAFPGEAPVECGYEECISLKGLRIEGEKMLKIRAYDEKGNKQVYARPVTIEAALSLSFSPAIDLNQAKIETFKDPNTLIGPITSADAELSRQMEEVIAEFQDRMEREPSILDWNSGLDLANSFPHLAVCSPPLIRSVDNTLPYLAHSMDIVVISSSQSQQIAEARRAAAVAVIRASNSQSDKLQHLTRRKVGKPPVSLGIEWLIDQSQEVLLPMISIIIPVYNNVSYTQSCLEQLSKTLPHDFNGEIIVVDDGSSDETAAVLEHWVDMDERIKVFRNPENAGFIMSCNRGAEAAQGDILIFLNNDTLPLPGWLPPLLRIFRDKPEAGAVGGKLVYPDGTLQEAGGVIFSDGSGCNFGKDDKAANAPLYNFMREVDYCSGAMLATRRPLFMEVGGFDTRFKPAYYEDTDYCFSLRKRGYRVYYQPESVIVHFEGASSGRDINTGVKSYQQVNRTKFIEKWSESLKHHYSAPDQYDFATLQSLSIRNMSANGHGN